MDIQHLRETCSQLISHMERNGYSWKYVRYFRSEIKHILTEPKPKKWSSYSDIYQEYVGRELSKHYLHQKRVVLGALERFELYGQYPDGQKHPGIVPQGKYPLLMPEFKEAVDYFCTAEKIRGRKDSPVANDALSAACFLYRLQQKGIQSFAQITEKDVLAVFASTEGSLHYSCSYKQIIVRFFKACLTQSPEIFEKLLAYLPPIRQGQKIVQYLLPEESERLKQVLTGEESSLSLRDRAIGMLAMYAGMRCCDIAGLTLDAIDWENDRIMIRQQKTDVHLELPMRAVVGNAIYDYLALERSKLECRNVFLSVKRPYGALKSGSLSNISSKIMDAAGVRQAHGDRRGLHLFRHRLATSLLANGVPRPVISRALGHASPASLDTYLSANLPRLKECAISIERFPVAKEVFQ